MSKLFVKMNLSIQPSVTKSKMSSLNDLGLSTLYLDYLTPYLIGLLCQIAIFISS
jgi:hypothetical protein